MAHPFTLHRRVRPLNFPQRPDSVTHWKIGAYQFIVDKLVNPCYRRLCYFKQASLLHSADPALTLAPSIVCSLFVVAKKVNSFGIKQIQPLFAKCRGGVGIPNVSTGHPGWGGQSTLCLPVISAVHLVTPLPLASLGCGVRVSLATRHSPLSSICL